MLVAAHCTTAHRKRLRWPGSAEFLALRRARSTVDLAASIARAARANIQGPSGNGRWTSISSRFSREEPSNPAGLSPALLVPEHPAAPSNSWPFQVVELMRKLGESFLTLDCGQCHFRLECRRMRPAASLRHHYYLLTAESSPSQAENPTISPSEFPRPALCAASPNPFLCNRLNRPAFPGGRLV